MFFGIFGQNVPTVTVEELHNSLQQKEKAIILDVRTPEEYASGKIKGSINLPLQELHEKLLTMLPEKEQKVYVYCRSGSRSMAAVNAMIKLGYTNVFNVEQGLLAWSMHTYPLV